MIIAIHLLLNQYQANDWHHAHCEGLVDWPPAPWRILRAIVAGSYNVHLPKQHQATLKGLLHKMAQVEPEYYLPHATYIQHRSPRPQMKPGTPPEIKPGKTLYAAGLFLDEEDSALFIHYPFELSETEDLVLRLIFNGLTYLGRKEAAAQWEIVEEMPESNAIPNPEGTRVVATPDANLEVEELWETLNSSAADVFAKNKQAVFPGVKQTAYELKDSHQAQLQTGQDKGSKSSIYSVTLETIGNHRIPLKYAHELCYNLHRSLVKRCPSPVFTGQEMGQPRPNHCHTFIQPILDSEERYIEGLQLIATERYSSDALASISAISVVRVGEQWVNLQLSDFSKSLGKSYQQWKTITPMFLTRFPKTLRGKPRYFSGTKHQKDGAAHQALKYLLFLDHLGLSGQPTFQATSDGLGMYLDENLVAEAQCQPWERFWQWQSAHSHGHKVGRVGYNVKLTFSKPVQAPIGLGYACHYGFGTLQPH